MFGAMEPGPLGAVANGFFLIQSASSYLVIILSPLSVSVSFFLSLSQ